MTELNYKTEEGFHCAACDDAFPTEVEAEAHPGICQSGDFDDMENHT